jgi:hypothetical protein
MDADPRAGLARGVNDAVDDPIDEFRSVTKFFTRVPAGS